MLIFIKNIFNKLVTHRGVKRYFYNTMWTVGEQVLRIISALLVGIWVTRYLGPKQFGIFSYVFAFVAIFGCIAQMGLDGIVVRSLVCEPNKRDIFLGTAFRLKLCGAIITLGVVAFATIFTSNDHVTNLYIFIIASGIIFQSFEVIDFYFQSKVLSKFVSLCKISQLLLSSFLKIYLVLTGADLIWFVSVSFFDQITLAVTLCVAYRYQNIGSFYRYFDWNVAGKLLKLSWPVIFTGLVMMVYMRSDQIIIKEVLGEREVGLYAAAIRLSEMWYFIPGAIVASLFPAVVNARKTNTSLYFIRLQRLYTFVVWIAIAIALPITFMSDWLVTLIYGEIYREAGKVLMIHIWGGVFVFLGVASNAYLLAENFMRKMLYKSICGAATNILLNFILIPRYGIYGAAIATLCAQVAVHYVYDIFDSELHAQLRLKTLAILNPMSLRDH
jgi:O-antigen/teichoic acid export membrane protein